MFQIPNIFDTNIKASTQSPGFPQVSLKDNNSVENKVSSSSQASIDGVPDFLNASIGTLQNMAAMSNQDQFIYSE